MQGDRSMTENMQDIGGPIFINSVVSSVPVSPLNSYGRELNIKQYTYYKQLWNQTYNIMMHFL